MEEEERGVSGKRARGMRIPVCLQGEDGAGVPLSVGLDMDQGGYGADVAPLEEVREVLVVDEDEEDGLRCCLVRPGVCGWTRVRCAT